LLNANKLLSALLVTAMIVGLFALSPGIARAASIEGPGTVKEETGLNAPVYEGRGGDANNINGTGTGTDALTGSGTGEGRGGDADNAAVTGADELTWPEAGSLNNDDTGTVDIEQGIAPEGGRGVFRSFAAGDEQGRYIVTKDSDDSLIGSYYWLADAVAACGTDGAYTIAATEDDGDVTDLGSNAGAGTIPAFDGTPTSGNTNAAVTIPSGENITLKSNGTGTYTITQQGAGRHIVTGGGLTLANIILDGGDAAATGGGVLVNSGGSLTIGAGAVIQNCASATGGGVLVNSDGALTMETGAVIKNSRAIAGGGVYMTAGTMTMNGGTISGNTATGSDNDTGGGGVYVAVSGKLTMKGGEISGNTATGKSSYYAGGGGVLNNGAFTMGGGTISGNTAADSGGGVYNYRGGTFTMEDGAISGNTATSGGGVNNFGGSVFNLNKGEISGNKAARGAGVLTGDGGARSVFNMYGGNIINNELVTMGGYIYYGAGVHVSSYGQFYMYDGLISGNRATATGSYAGGVYANGTMEMNGGEISGNIANYAGGVYLNFGGNTFLMNGGKISGNTAISGSGGGVYAMATSNSNSQFTMNGGEISGNTASAYGGGIYRPSSFPSRNVTLNGGVICGNTAISGGGVYTADYSQLVSAAAVVFYGNKANTAYNIGLGLGLMNYPNIRWAGDNSIPGTHLLNNYDVNYTSGAALTVYTVTYKAGSGTGADYSQIATALPVKAVTAAAAGFSAGANRVFLNWNTSADGSGASYDPADNLSFPASRAITLYAQWADIYTVTYDGNGNTGGQAPEDTDGNAAAGTNGYIDGSAVTVQGNPGSLVKTDCNFLGWAEDSAATAPDFAVDDTSVTPETFVITSDVRLYAVWAEVPKYTVKYEPGTHGTFAEQIDSDLHYGDETPPAPPVTGEDGWIFVGWDQTPVDTVTGDVTYTAQWTARTVMFTVVFEDRDGTVLKTQQVPSGGNATAPAAPKHSGYNFTGWDHSYKNVTRNLTIKAQYSSIPAPAVVVPAVTPAAPTLTPPPTPVPAPTPTPVTAPAPTVIAPQDTPSATVDAGSPTAPIEDPTVPLAAIPAPDLNTWALVNLILAAAGVAFAIMAIIRLARRRKNDQADEADSAEQQGQGRTAWLVASVAMGVIGAVVFFLTEDMTRRMALVDGWTVVNAILFAIALAGYMIAARRAEDDKGYIS